MLLKDDKFFMENDKYNRHVLLLTKHLQTKGA